MTVTIDDPERIARFVTVVNSPGPDPTITRAEIRGRRVPDAVS